MSFTSIFRRVGNTDKAWRAARTRPRLECLEDRQLLDGGLASIGFVVVMFAVDAE